MQIYDQILLPNNFVFWLQRRAVLYQDSHGKTDSGHCALCCDKQQHMKEVSKLKWKQIHI